MNVLRGLVVIGLLLSAGGVWLLTTDLMAQEASRVAGLPRVDVTGALRIVPGTTVLVEGTLECGETAGPRGFMVYHRERFMGRETSGPNQGQENWTRLHTARPPVAIQSNGAALPVKNQDYRLENWPHTEKTEEVPRYVSLREATERFLGFKSGDRITIEGPITADSRRADAPKFIVADVLSGGDAAAYVEAKRGGVVVFKVLGGVFIGLGALMMLGAGVLLRSIRR